ncbi:hypothetical protein [Neptunicella marina]|uniref:Uncharacterized protein n=1 Tax=Neptunicella marina TaxID=2125989 RepID=A0A8J6IUK0_9ALTE|nr:hypothetical protein [Neptunicella marina]MBC3765748.1 hypothetical protein [Neptunicella marina]
MKKAFILIIEIAILYLILRSAFVQYMLTDVHKTLSDWMTEISQVHHRQTLEQLRGNMSGFTQQFSEAQLDYFNKVTYSPDQVLRFHDLYCVKKDKNPFIYGDSLKHFCSQIEQLKSRL